MTSVNKAESGQTGDVGVAGAGSVSAEISSIENLEGAEAEHHGGSWRDVRTRQPGNKPVTNTPETSYPPLQTDILDRKTTGLDISVRGLRTCSETLRR